MKGYDAAIIGGGIIGAAVAWELARAGRRVIVLDRQQPGMEASWAAAGMLAPGAETPDSVPVAPLGRASLALYPEFVAAVEADSGMRVEYEAGEALQMFLGEQAEQEREEFLRVHRGLGLAGEEVSWEEAVRIEPALGMRRGGQEEITDRKLQVTNEKEIEDLKSEISKAKTGEFKIPDSRFKMNARQMGDEAQIAALYMKKEEWKGALSKDGACMRVLRMKNEARVEPRLLVAAVLAAGEKRGVEVRAGCAVKEVRITSGRVRGVQTEAGEIEAECVVVAAGSWSGGLAGLRRYAPTRPVRGQMVALRSERVRVRHVLRSHSGYIVPRADGRLICGSTAETEAGFEKRVTPEGQQKILATAVELVPALADAEVVETWSGLRPDTPDHLPSLGPTDIERLYMATGHYRNGILLSAITARLLREWIVEGGAKSFAVEAFSPMRFL